MSAPVTKLQILTRAEMALVHIRTQRTIRKAAFFAVAMVFGLLGLGMMNYAIFYAVNKTQGPATGALVVALLDIAVAVIMILIANKTDSNVSDEKLALEIRDIAQNELNKDLDKAKGEIEKITNDVRTIGSGVVAVTGAAASTIGPIVKVLGMAGKKR